jgi:hypothetical protein
MFMGRFSREAASAFNPETHDFFWHDDGTVSVIRLRWWDDASYSKYQGDDHSEATDVKEQDVSSFESIKPHRSRETAIPGENPNELPF